MKNKFIIYSLLLVFMICLFPNICFATQKDFKYDGDIFKGSIPSETDDSNYKTEAENSGATAMNRIGNHFKNVNELNNALDRLFGQIRWVISIISIFGTITSFLIFSYAFVRLATYPTDPILRRKCMVDILQSGVATVLLGGLSLILTVFYKTFMGFIQNSIMLSSDYKAAFALALNEYKYLISGILGVLALTMLILFIKDVLDLAAHGRNPQERAKHIRGLMITGLATVGFGGTGIFVAIFNGLLTF